jgi:hypothetical protein
MRATNWDDDWDNQLIEKNIIILKAYNSCEYAK